jgi:arginase
MSKATMSNEPMQHRLAEVQPGDVVLLGVPWDRHSSFLRGPALAPPVIRATLHNGASNLCAENGYDLGEGPRWRDLGDIVVPAGDDEEALQVITETSSGVIARGARLLSLGGDHAVSFPLLRAHGRAYPNLTVLHIDAHPDLYDELDGDHISHACPFARALEEGLIGRLVQVGIRTLNPHQRAQAARFGVEIVEMRDWRPDLDLRLTGPLYLSLDLDALDPAFAPGVSHHEPGGFTTREVLGIIQRLPAPLVGADLVELNPVRDSTGITAALAAKLVKEISVQLLAEAPHQE